MWTLLSEFRQLVRFLKKQSSNLATIVFCVRRYYSRVSFQHTGMELIDQLKTNMTGTVYDGLTVSVVLVLVKVWEN